MRIIDISLLTKDIHFPVMRACYTPTPKRNIFQKSINFMTYKRKFEVMQEYLLWIPSIRKFCFIPVTFIFDGASVPKILNGIFNPTGVLLLGALPHDFGYRYKGLFLIDPSNGEVFFQEFTKSELDSIFFDLCSWESELPFASRIATLALCLFGFIGWIGNRKRNEVLEKDFPGVYAEIKEEL